MPSLFMNTSRLILRCRPSSKAATERLLWHQRLGHPSDYYLFNAHRHADGIPRFPHMDCVLNICPTCICSKQIKNAAGGNTTRTAEQPYQGLSIDFSFSGTRSKNTFNRFPVGTKVKKKFGDKIFKGKVVHNPEDTQLSGIPMRRLQ